MFTRITAGSKYSLRQYVTMNESAASKLKLLRGMMNNIDALVVTSEDAHQSEYTAECDNRRTWLSGFTGSAGLAVVTKENAALFTDGRYFLQASNELDSSVWTLMKQGTSGVPSWQEYLAQSCPHSRIGIDPSTISAGNAANLEKTLLSVGSSLVYTEDNVIDKIRTDRPSRPAHSIKVHPLEYAGKSVAEKMKDLRDVLSGRNMIISSLDEIAWLLNLRGSDIYCSPVFFSYCIVTSSSTILYIQPEATNSFSPEVRSHLKEADIEIRDYDTMLRDVPHIEGRFLVDNHTTNMSIIQAVGKDRIDYQQGHSPVVMAKSIKNTAELNGMRDCHMRDAVALCKHFAWLENKLVVDKQPVREYEAAKHLESMRQLDDYYVGLSFDTISATGPNGAIIHYKPDVENSSLINPHHLYLCDSGAQYRHGTTDVTRTYLFQDEPTELQKRAFTRVLQAHIAIDSTLFPEGTTGKISSYQLDSIARQPLWRDGLDFRHGVGHGVGAYLNVHEGPQGIGSRPTYQDIALQSGMVVTNEPGYYEEGEFGIRIENVLIVDESLTADRLGHKQMLGFEHITFVPIGRKLIENSLLNESDTLWINEYHNECRRLLEPLLEGDSQTLAWIERETMLL
ncbi:peptidase M24, structural domain-containing protein [Pilobolus umbonatus]|nr:peptidase M24, structural domain-containing protein [Pilobolus umbonatus]